MEAPESPPSANSDATDPKLNSVRASQRKQSAQFARDASTAASANVVPEPIARRFIQVRNKYYFPGGARAFTDRGNRLTTPSENTEVVRSLIGIAQARGWHEITVRGTERFRQEAWVQATLVGLQVRGYNPSEVEQARVVRNRAQDEGRDAGASSPGADADSIAPTTVGESRATVRPPRAARAPLLTGQLLDYGRATYQHDPKATMSYFVKLKTARGQQVLWGVDLERAFKESLTKPERGDEVGLRSIRRDPVTVRVATRDEAGEVTGEGRVEKLRNRWVVEKLEFFDSRAAAARAVLDASVTPKQGTANHPELVGTYLQVHAAQLAARMIRDPQDRARFVAMVRETLADSVARGEPLPAVRLRERTKRRTPDPLEREPEAAR
jgi:conjugative element/phage-associated large polyvalent protein